MLQVVNELRQAQLNDGPPLVVDTCGSVIYAGDDIKKSLRELTQVFYLEASDTQRAQLFERYIAEPKPVIWGSVFSQGVRESPHEALARCYPELLFSRARLYEQWSHIRIPFDTHRAVGISPTAVFSELQRDSGKAKSN